MSTQAIAKMKKIFSNNENMLYFIISTLLSINTLLFIAKKTNRMGFLENNLNTDLFYLLYFILGIILLGIIFFPKRKLDLNFILKRIILTLLPSEFLLIYAIGPDRNSDFSSNISILVGFFAVLISIYLVCIRKNNLKIKENDAKKQKYSQRKKVFIVIFLFLITITNLIFGYYHIEKANVVDEPLWIDHDGRIIDFWESIKEKNWNGTRVSDKPGVTVAYLSGIGLFFEDPRVPSSLENLNLAFRLPILFFCALSLSLIYFLIQKLIDWKTAIISTTLIGLSPIIIGMERIVNPDSILWVFSTISILSYLIFTQERKKKYLIFSGISLGFALLTKYIANIIFIYIFLIILAEYFYYYSKKYSSVAFVKYLRESLIDYSILIIITISTFFSFYPATWVKYDRLLTATIESQAFGKTLPIFIAFAGILFFDKIINNYRLTTKIIEISSQHRNKLLRIFFGIVLLIFIIVLANTYSGMKFFDFESILSSPKSGFSIGGFWGLFIANFYPLIFGVNPLALISIFLLLILSIINKKLPDNKMYLVFIFLCFIVAYQFATTINHVASIIRYQIILYPLFLIVSAIALQVIYSYLQKINKIISAFFALLLLSCLIYGPISTKPFFLSYSSEILPQKYYIDHKDMGLGSYEAAEFLNSIPNANLLKIWSDKSGVCKNFIGTCESGTDFKKLSQMQFDYYVISSGREARNSGFVQRRLGSSPDYLLRFDLLYSFEEYIFNLELGGRPRNYVRIIDAKKIDISYTK